MNQTEASKIIRILTSAFSSYKPPSINDAAEVWQIVFSDVPFEAVSAALYSYISRGHEFAPTPGQIKETLNHFLHPNELTEAEAWNMVLIALRNGIYGAEEEYDRLPEDVQKAIGSPHYLHDLALQEDVNYSVESSNFYKRYRTVLERKREIDALPSGIRKKVMGQLEAKKTKQLDKQSQAIIEDRKHYAMLVEKSVKEEDEIDAELSEKVKKAIENGRITSMFKAGQFRKQEQENTDTIDTMFA